MAIDPVLFSMGALEVRWYGLVYALGFLAGGYWLQYAEKKGWIHLGKDKNWDLVMYLVVGGILGARLFEIFWEPSYYLGNLVNVLKIWQGGMSFHGGLAGGLLGLWLFARKEKKSFLKLGDLVSLPFMLALAFGRVANYINQELPGIVWNGSWCIELDGCRHPSTLYAAGKRFLVFGWLWFLYQKDKFKPGFIMWNLIFWDGLGRVIVDFYREDVLYSGLKLGQWFSLVMVVAALYAFWKYYKDDWKKVFS